MINVLFYGYKSKNILDACLKLRDNASSNNIRYRVIDKSNINKNSVFAENEISYSYNKWDDLRSKYQMILNDMHGLSDEDFILLVNDSLVLNKDWDIFLTNSIDLNSSIISGNHSVYFDDIYKFFPAVRLGLIENLEKTNWIEDSIIFGKVKLVRTILQNTERLKQNGFNIMSSFNAFINNISVYSIPTKMLDESLSTYNTQDYFPFSKNHNYNEVIKFVKGRESIFGKADTEKVKRFNELIRYGIDQLYEIPFQTNDTEYNQHMEIDDLSEQRFLNTIKSIG